MTCLLILTVAVVAVSAQYSGNVANDNNGYVAQSNVQPEILYERRHHSKKKNHGCPLLRTYIGSLPGATKDAFYPPVIRYVRDKKEVKALVVCNQSPKNLNALFARRNESHDIRDAHLVGFGTSIGSILTCDKRRRRYFGDVLDAKSNSTINVAITQFTCFSLEKTASGMFVERKIKDTVEAIRQILASQANTTTTTTTTKQTARKKREVTETPEATTPTTKATEVTTPTTKATEATTPTTKATEATTPTTKATEATTPTTKATEATTPTTKATEATTPTTTATEATTGTTTTPLIPEISPEQVQTLGGINSVVMFKLAEILGNVLYSK